MSRAVSAVSRDSDLHLNLKAAKLVLNFECRNDLTDFTKKAVQDDNSHLQ